MMLQEKLKNYKLILASASPRRHQFFKELKLNFEVRLKSIEEIYPLHLKGNEISDYLSKLKASAFKESLQPNEILITSDTVVWHANQSLAKPVDKRDAYHMLHKLSDDTHEVITSVSFTTTEIQKTISYNTKVSFKELTDEEIWFYIDNYEPFDKAGAYGIQDWLGLIAINKIEGSYTNVMGLPTHLVYKSLLDIAGQ